MKINKIIENMTDKDKEELIKHAERFQSYWQATSEDIQNLHSALVQNLEYINNVIQKLDERMKKLEEKIR